MEVDQIIKTLQGIRAGLVESKMRVYRKSSWRESEKAMTIASFNDDIEAMDVAIQNMKEKVS